MDYKQHTKQRFVERVLSSNKFHKTIYPIDKRDKKRFLGV